MYLVFSKCHNIFRVLNIDRALSPTVVTLFVYLTMAKRWVWQERYKLIICAKNCLVNWHQSPARYRRKGGRIHLHEKTKPCIHVHICTLFLYHSTKPIIYPIHPTARDSLQNDAQRIVGHAWPRPVSSGWTPRKLRCVDSKLVSVESIPRAATSCRLFQCSSKRCLLFEAAMILEISLNLRHIHM